MAGTYPSTSPYMYCMGNPIILIDPDGNSSFVPNDYFTKSGEYLGSDNAKTDEVRIIDKSTFNNINYYGSKMGATDDQKTAALIYTSTVADGSKLSSEAANNICSYYYGIAGFNISELSGQSIGADINSNPFSSDVAVTDFDNSSNKLKIDVEKAYIGNDLNNKYDIINLLIHERKGHGNDFLKAVLNGKNPLYQRSKDYWPWEKTATQMQIKDASWEKTSPQFKQMIYNAYGHYDIITSPQDRAKYFGKYGINSVTDKY